MSSSLRYYEIIDSNDSWMTEGAEKFNELQAIEGAEKKGPLPLAKLSE